jgi:16S rRNA (guanine527-N7)-methyltransferase
LDIILKYFSNLSPTQLEQFKQLGILYPDWNNKINVISRKDIEFLYERHILHSLGIAKVIQFEKGTKLLDVGTGGGFPGIPLAILFPESEFHLVDSIGKKLLIVADIAEKLGIKNVKVTHTRAENIKDEYDFIISRAVTRLGEFQHWIKKNVAIKSKNKLKNGILYLKGGDLTEEISESKLNCKIYPLSDYFTEEFFETKKVVYAQIPNK